MSKEKLDTYTISNDNIEKNIERKYVYNQIENGEVVTKNILFSSLYLFASSDIADKYISFIFSITFSFFTANID